MKRLLPLALLPALAVLACFAASRAMADPAAETAAAEAPKPVEDWKADPQAQLVFFAVLEGLYRDGVDDAVVDSIVPRDKTGKEKMKHSFVLDCPLCQPAFEAFCAYQARPRFSDGSEKSTFGPGLPEDLRGQLLSKVVSTRLIALRGPIGIWVEAKLKQQQLDEEERREWWLAIAQRSQQGGKALRGLQKTDPNYKNWAGYWGCAACLGSEDATRSLMNGSRTGE